MVYWVLPEVGGSIPAARGGCACASVGSKVVFFGGADRLTHAYSDVWVLETANGAYQWTQMATTSDPGCEITPLRFPPPTATGVSIPARVRAVSCFLPRLCIHHMPVLDPLPVWKQTWGNRKTEETCGEGLCRTCSGHSKPLSSPFPFAFPHPSLPFLSPSPSAPSLSARCFPACKCQAPPSVLPRVLSL
eukprot:CAMPEP_0117653110 /NCGR_PEP_ID=MMETSP0804-20121206/3011_1 /TAXON_ID=1074897 /ORGANISM="Tetraselmis astigmatica, Strain CCMP880" /LENGTH=189 /DNA_ID=CAMNT_0005459253 /DNA_START=58 /DNA_END=623 /DNA_ORIENTATION=+